MHVFNYNSINNFFNRLLDAFCRPRVGDWYVTRFDNDYDDDYGVHHDGVYVVEDISGDWATTRYCGISDGYRSNMPQKLLISVLNDNYRRVKRAATTEEKV